MPILLDDGRSFPTNQERIDALEFPVTRQLFQDLQDALLDMFGDERGSVADMTKEREAELMSTHQQRKLTRAERVEIYAEQVENNLDMYEDKRTIGEITDPDPGIEYAEFVHGETTKELPLT